MHVHRWCDDSQSFTSTTLGNAAAVAGMSTQMALDVKSGVLHVGVCEGCILLPPAVCRVLSCVMRSLGLLLHAQDCFFHLFQNVVLSCSVLLRPHADIERARIWGLVTGNELHAMFLVTPMWELERITPQWGQ